ncbi:hypothetical protein [Prescottella equi]|uniref:hypothetical protein n=1 Tax=Rhodococcus hoagii TaxID=43767 RepID=UPI000A0FA67D|nr:hypothetical protein [Prescottella equi]ORM11713.1 hypothetical protein A5N74_23550 [Prescottella equi]
MSSPDPFGWQQPPITPMTAEERIEADDCLETSGASTEAIDLVRRRIAAAAASRKFVVEG